MLKRKKALVSWTTSKVLEDHRRLLKLMLTQSSRWWRKTSSKVKNCLEKVDVPLSTSTGMLIQNKVQTTGNIQQQEKKKFDFGRNHLKKPPLFWNQILWTKEIKIIWLHHSGWCVISQTDTKVSFFSFWFPGWWNFIGSRSRSKRPLHTGFSSQNISIFSESLCMYETPIFQNSAYILQKPLKTFWR